MRISQTIIVLILGLIVTAIACGEKDSSENVLVIGTNTDGEQNIESQGGNQAGIQAEPLPMDQQTQDQIQLGLGIMGGSQHFELAQGLSETMAETVAFASQNAGTGQIVTSGTITQSGQNFSYSGSPTDRLVLQLTGAPAITFYITQLNGDLSGIERFFNSEHQMQFRVQSENFDLNLSSQISGINRLATISGNTTINGLNYQLQIEKRETLVAGVDFNAADHTSESQLTGQISSSNGFQVELSEGYRYRLYVYENAVENLTISSNNRWSIGGQNYELRDAMIRHETLNGWPNPSDYWIAAGSLLRDGQVIGAIGMEQQALWIDVFLQLNDGDRLQLKRHLLHTEDQR